MNTELKPHTTPKDFFIHLGSIIGLYVTAVSLLALLFQLINTLFPDPALYEYAGNYSSGIRFAIASLIIAFPLYLWLMRMISKDMTERPETAELPIRKWLTYFTLFIAGATVAVDLIVLINTFLSGELTVRFLLKVLAVLLVAATIFTYYRFELKRDKSVIQPQIKMIGIVASIAIILSIVGSFFVIGSPLTARSARLDDRRISDLQTIQWQVVNYWQQKKALPQTLDGLTDSISGFSAPRDPATGTAYEYKVTGPLTFSLCATFDLDSTTSAVSRPVMYDTFENWQHKTDRQCFDRTIDPDRYGPNTTKPVPIY